MLQYFPDACMEVGYVSYMSNEQHSPGTKMHWDKSKSIGEGDEIVRHLMDKEIFDTDGLRHRAKAAWRALELLQREIEATTQHIDQSHTNEGIQETSEGK